MGKMSDLKGIVNLLSKKWTLLILFELKDGKKRFNELIRDIGEISPRSLSLRLKDLEHNRLVQKKRYREIPPKVEYSLTEAGIDLTNNFVNLENWVEKWKVNL